MPKALWKTHGLLLLVMALSACQPMNIGNPTEGDQGYVYGQEATVESLEVLLLESFPVQVRVVVTGYLPDGCVELVEILPEQGGFDFNLTLLTRRLAGEVECTEALVPFEESVALDAEGLPAGTYTVTAQDQAATFTFAVDNVLQTGDLTLPPVQGAEDLRASLTVSVLNTDPAKVKVTLRGTLPDNCTKIDSIEAEREGRVFTLNVLTRKPDKDKVCAMVLAPFTKTVWLDVAGLPAGEYTVTYRGISASFTLGG